MDVTGQIVGEFLKTGIIGALLVVAGFVIRSLNNSYQAVQEKRIQESQANTERFLTALNLSTVAQDKTAEALKTLTSVIQASSSGGGRR